ncbi:MAG TPA: LacI family DNA-binding transcriptional regulator [Rariglobus sp.]
MQPRVTVRDLALRAGVHFTTVSMALRNHPRIPEETRNRIKKLAAEMGYRPDAMLNALSSYRTSLRKPRFKATLAWINSEAVPARSHPVVLFREYHEGARDRADSLGYGLEEIHLTEPGLTRDRVGSILKARGIEGVLVAPLPRGQDSINLLPWEKLASVTFGYSLQHPPLHTVTASQYHAMRTILRELRALGYRRIGYVSDREFERRCDGNWQAAFWVDANEQPPARRVPPFICSDEIRDRKKLREWLHRHRPEVLVQAGIVGPWLRRELAALKLDVPGDIGLVSHDVATGDKVNAGIDEKGRVTGAAAVDLLVAMINRQEFGPPDNPHQLLIEGRWVQGSTVRRLRERGPAAGAASRPAAGS